jgi:hypothetical protein
MSRQKAPAILDAGLSLEQRLDEVPYLTRGADGERKRHGG